MAMEVEAAGQPGQPVWLAVDCVVVHGTTASAAPAHTATHAAVGALPAAARQASAPLQVSCGHGAALLLLPRRQTAAWLCCRYCRRSPTAKAAYSPALVQGLASALGLAAGLKSEQGAGAGGRAAQGVTQGHQRALYNRLSAACREFGCSPRGSVDR